MLSRPDSVGRDSERVALKDERLVYRACSLAFARCLGADSPDQVIGKTDFDLLPNPVAREQMVLDSRAIHSRRADIGTIALGVGPDGAPGQAMIVRTPVLASGEEREVRGIDIRLLGAPLPIPPVAEGAPAVSIDYRTLVNDGLQGSLIYADDRILFADDNAARVLGHADAAELAAAGPVDSLFGDGELVRIMAAVERAHAPDAGREAGRLALTANTRSGEPVRLIGRGARVQWGATSATLLSFVDVALPAGASADGGRIVNGGSTSTAVALASVAGGRGSDRGQGDATPNERERRLRVSEQRFRHYAHAAADFFWELDAKLQFRAVSADLERVLGIPRDRVIGRTHRQLVDYPGNIGDADRWAEHLELIESHRPFRDFEFHWSVDGDTRVIRYSGLPLFDRERRFVGYRGVGCDVTSAVRQAETTAYHANHDALTGLVNRRHFESKIVRALDSSGQRRETHALCFLDLDNFKIVNDTCGHQAGDELLRQLARLFDSLVRKSDMLARLGGDEFGIFLYRCDVAGALKLANQIRAEVESFQFIWEEKRFKVGVSTGLVVVDDRWESVGSLFAAADSACYIAKNEGRNRVVVYREGEGNASNRKVATHWVEEIDGALAEGRLQLARQPIVPLQGAADGERHELLLRLRMPNGDIVSPRAFLPAAERYGLSAALDRRAVDMTLAWLRRHPSLEHGIRHVSLNLGSGAFTDEAFADRLLRRIDESGVPPAKLCFELAETATVANLAKASEFMARLSTIGCRFAIDDFGSGLSSFAWLRDLPIDFLKIDGRLIGAILDDPIDHTTVRAIGEICRSMGKRTVAQFVESPRHLNAVRDIGIDFAQGYHVGKPELIATELLAEEETEAPSA